MKRIKKLFAVFFAISMAVSLLAVPAAGAEVNYTYYVMAKTCASDVPAEYYVEDEELAQALAELTIGSEPVFAVEKAQDSDVWYIAASDEQDCTPQEVAGALAAIRNFAIESGATDGNRLALGYGALVLVETRAGTYFVVEVAGPSQSLFERPEAADKNDVPTTQLVVSGMDDAVKSVEIGSQVTYTISLTVPKGSDDMQLCLICPGGLTFSPETTTVTIDNTPVTAEWTAWSEPTADPKDSSKLEYTMTIPKSGVTYGNTIKFSCTVTVNEKAKIAEANMLETYVRYGHELNNRTNAFETNLFTFGFDLKKLNGAGVALSGVQFTLHRTTDTDTFYYVPPAESQNTNDGDNQTGTTQKVEARFRTLAQGQDPTPVTTDKDGIARFTGLAAGEYVLTETASVDGYTVLSDPITIKIDENGALKAEGFTISDEIKDTLLDSSGLSLTTYNITYSTIKIVNHPNTVMPSTGGRGTAIFYLAGSILMLSAAVLLLRRKKLLRPEQK